MNEVNTLISICHKYGIRVSPFDQQRLMPEYEKHKIPDNILTQLSKEKVEKYVKALIKCSWDEAYQWTIGHRMLEELGFSRKETRQGHRVYVGYVWETTL
jgi:hypothetical protein